MIDMSVNIGVSCLDLLSKGMHRLAILVQVFVSNVDVSVLTTI